MKKFNFLAICATALALGSCVKDADVLPDNKTEASAGNTEFVFTIPNAGSSARSVEDSGVHDQGIPEEYKVNNVDVYLFDAATEQLVSTYSLQGIALSSDTSSDLIVRYTSDKFDVDPGTYNIYAVANSASKYNVSDQDQFLAYEDPSYANSALMAQVPSAGFIMTSRGSDNLNQTISVDEEKVVTIELERVVVKVDVAQDSDSFDLKDASGNKYANVKLHNYMMVNLPTNYYLFRHEADLTSFAAPTYTAAVNFGDVSDNNGYVIDPYFFKKVAADADKFGNADGFFKQPLQDAVFNPTWTSMPSVSTSSVNYCLENTMYQDAQLNAYTTGLVFQARVTPTAVITATGTTTNWPNVVYYCNQKFYDSVATLGAALGGTIVGVDDSSTTAELQAKSITRLTLNNNAYLCYYNYWIKHVDNKDPNVMGVMEFGVVRNNHYKLSINSVADLGTGVPDVDLDRPDETNETLTVNFNVVPWIVREQGSVELK